MWCNGKILSIQDCRNLAWTKYLGFLNLDEFIIPDWHKIGILDWGRNDKMISDKSSMSDLYNMRNLWSTFNK